MPSTLLFDYLGTVPGDHRPCSHSAGRRNDARRTSLPVILPSSDVTRLRLVAGDPPPPKISTGATAGFFLCSLPSAPFWHRSRLVWPRHLTRAPPATLAPHLHESCATAILEFRPSTSSELWLSPLRRSVTLQQHRKPSCPQSSPLVVYYRHGIVGTVGTDLDAQKGSCHL